MDDSLLAQGLRVTGLLLEAVGEPGRLGPALHAMTRLMDADLGMLASARRGDAGAGAALMATRSGSYSGQDADLAFPALRCYRRWGALQPAGRLHRESEIRRLAQEQDGAGTTDDEATPGTYCLSHVDAGEGRICYVGFTRHGNARFDPERIGVTESLLTHLGRACAINRRIESMRTVGAAVMERFERCHVGVAMVAEDGTIRYRNDAARRLVDEADGLRVDDHGRIVTREPAETEALLQAIREHIAGAANGRRSTPRLLRIARAAGAAPLAVAFSPFRGEGDPRLPGSAGGSAVLMIYNPDRPPRGHRDVIAQVYNLSSQEAELVCAIAAGDTLEDIARVHRRSLEAVRSQLKRVFRKTGTSRQTELVRLALIGPAAMVQ